MATVTVHTDFQDAAGNPLSGAIFYEPATDWADGLKVTPPVPVVGPLVGHVDLEASACAVSGRVQVDGEPEQQFLTVIDGLKHDVPFADLPRGLCDEVSGGL